MYRSLELVFVLIRVLDVVLLICWFFLGKFLLLFQKVFIKIIDINICNLEEVYGGRIVDIMFCVGYLEGSIDVCQVSLEIIYKDYRGYK